VHTYVRTSTVVYCFIALKGTQMYYVSVNNSFLVSILLYRKR